MTPLVFGSTERGMAAIDPPETSWVRLERWYRRAKRAALANGFRPIAHDEPTQCKVVHNDQRQFEMSDKASSGRHVRPLLLIPKAKVTAVDLSRLVSRALSFDFLRSDKTGECIPRADSVRDWCSRYAGSSVNGTRPAAIQVIVRS
jgi:hypothetical protein